MKKAILLTGIAMLLLISLAAAEDNCFYTFHKGDKICRSAGDCYNCSGTTCLRCVTFSNLYLAPSWLSCSKYCDSSTEPPTEPDLSLNVNFPFDSESNLNKLSWAFNISTNKNANIYLIDKITGIQKVLCSQCKKYASTLSFKIGENDLIIRAVNGLEIRESSKISFFIDNKKPVITRTLPLSNKYAATVFTVFYDEANFKEIKLRYGNNATGWKESVLQNCQSGKKQNCSIDLSLKEYDNQQITYWFEIKDIANNLATGRQTKIYVDETKPSIVLFSYPLGKGYINFNMTIVEKNFFKIEYMDNNSITKPIWKTICSSLRNGNCFKKIYFRAGEHNLDIRVSDKAGNYAFEHVNFNIV